MMALVALVILAQDTVPFEVKGGIVWVQATVNGQGPFKFIFDTGASITVIKPATAKKVGLVEKEPGLFSFLNPTLVKANAISLGKAEAKDVVCAVMTVPQADIPLKLQGETYDGIIGYTYISQFEVTLNYKKGQMKLEPSGYEPVLDERLAKLIKDAPAAKPGFKIGISYRALTAEEAKQAGVEGGVVVEAVAKASPAHKGEMKKGDIVTEINGAKVKDSESYRKALASIKSGDTVKVRLVRDKKDIQLELK